MAKSRLIGDYPVIGIRPTIDGRRGVLKVRESLEEQTMNMAKSAAKLFEENLRYTNGEPVKVVIADTTIGRVAEAAACADKFKGNMFQTDLSSLASSPTPLSLYSDLSIGEPTLETWERFSSPAFLSDLISYYSQSHPFHL